MKLRVAAKWTVPEAERIAGRGQSDIQDCMARSRPGCDEPQRCLRERLPK